MSAQLYADRQTDAAVARNEQRAKLAEALATAGPVPCVGEDSDDWTSEDRAELMRASFACRACPVAQLCRETADRNHERAGAWGGVIRGDWGKPVHWAHAIHDDLRAELGRSA